VRAEFPEHPPYEGVFDDVVPHLTLGERRAATTEQLRAAEADVSPLLPVTTRVDRVHLLAGSAEPGSWRVLHELPLAEAD
jgi:2'-5' RNA ligase